MPAKVLLFIVFLYIEEFCASYMNMPQHEFNVMLLLSIVKFFELSVADMPMVLYFTLQLDTRTLLQLMIFTPLEFCENLKAATRMQFSTITKRLIFLRKMQ